jgi:hypothetical protein
MSIIYKNISWFGSLLLTKLTYNMNHPKVIKNNLTNRECAIMEEFNNCPTVIMQIIFDYCTPYLDKHNIKFNKFYMTVLSCVRLNDSMYAFGYCGGYIDVCNVKSNNCTFVRRFDINIYNNINNLYLFGDKLFVFCSLDRILHIININTGYKYLTIYTELNSCVMTVFNDLLFVYAKSNNRYNIDIYSMKTFKHINTILLDMEAIIYLEVSKNNTLIIGNKHGAILLYEINDINKLLSVPTYYVKKYIVYPFLSYNYDPFESKVININNISSDAHYITENMIRSDHFSIDKYVLMDDDNLIIKINNIGVFMETIGIYNLKNKIFTAILHGRKISKFSLFKNDYIIVEVEDSIKIIHIESKECVQIVEVDHVNLLNVDDTSVMVQYADNNIKLYY